MSRRLGGRVANAVAAWATVGEQRCYFRSRAELRHAQRLEMLRKSGAIVSWEHEPKRFDFPEIRRGVTSYLPDFRVVYPDGRVEWHEVKGWMDPRSRVALTRMAKYYPDETVIVNGFRWPLRLRWRSPRSRGRRPTGPAGFIPEHKSRLRRKA